MTGVRTTPEGVSWSVDPRAGAFPGGYRLLRAEAFIPLPRERVFPFFAAAENLERITPPDLRFRIVSPLPVEMRRGALIDTQLRGPYHTWIHRHAFEEADGGTRMLDEVRWRVPLWPLGAPAIPLVRARVARIFRYRQETIGRLLLA